MSKLKIKYKNLGIISPMLNKYSVSESDQKQALEGLYCCAMFCKLDRMAKEYGQNLLLVDENSPEGLDEALDFNQFSDFEFMALHHANNKLIQNKVEELKQNGWNIINELPCGTKKTTEMGIVILKREEPKIERNPESAGRKEKRKSGRSLGSYKEKDRDTNRE